MPKVSITIPRAKRNRTNRVDGQLRLFLSKPDCLDISGLGYERAGELESAEGMQERNRAACVQQFVVKKHRATRLHYDFRLGWNRVLISWAVPEGPSYCPSHSRKAIEVEDHRKEYLGFEGVLPAGKPGAGPTMPWDWGMWIPQPGYFDVDKALRNGELRFTLCGEKLKGNWILCRTGNKTIGGDPIWMLTKEPDSFARSEGVIDILEEQPNSVRTERTLEEIEREWYDGKAMYEYEAALFEI